MDRFRNLLGGGGMGLGGAAHGTVCMELALLKGRLRDYRY